MQLTRFEQLALDSSASRDAELARDPGRRRRDGIVHTPPALARFVVRAADAALRSALGVTRGLGDATVDVVDPACGPGAFLAAALDGVSVYGGGASVVGIDSDARALSLAAPLLQAAVASGLHLTLVHADTLRDERLREQLADPARPLVVVGNPPWTVSASTPTDAMQGLLEDFRRDAQGERLPERRLGVLSDAYVRFMRWAAELARARPAGAVVGLVTNASFLDGPVHRGMRAALARWFDTIDVVDLGGNALLGREAGVGARDGNVFGVRPAVAVSVFVRAPGRDDRCARVRYARIWGGKQDKLDALATATFADFAWSSVIAPELGTRLGPRASGASDARYERWPSLADCMPFHREGVQTNRDAAVVDVDRERLLERLRAFVAGRSAPSLQRAQLHLAHYDPARARAAVATALEADPDGTRGLSVRRIAYRPFDVRYFCPVTPFCHRPRPDLLAAFDHAALALVTVRKDRGSVPYAHFALVDCVIDNCFLSARSSCRARAFPLRTPDGHENLAPEVRDELSRRVGGGPIAARTFLVYSLAVLAAPAYRERFATELRADYPRVVWPRSRDELERVAAVGAQLAERFLAPDGVCSTSDTATGCSLPTTRIGHHLVAPGRAQALEEACRAADAAVAPLLGASA